MRVKYDFNSSYEVKSDKRWLRWDFIIKTDGGEPLFIEYDGVQHFKVVCFGGISQDRANKKFEKQKKYDKLKNDYCNENGYLLLRIPYTAYGSIDKLVADFIIENTDWGLE
jgi:very-short-patch-repair endonuclease